MTGPQLYRPSLALLTDLYQLTMAQGYWKSGMEEIEACFALFFRQSPFGGGYALACGLEQAIDFLTDFRFDDQDLAYLAELRGNDGALLFDSAFVDNIGAMKLSCDVDAVPEGTVVFPFEPLVRVVGPIVQCQLLETALLNLVNFHTLVATKAARVCHAAQGDPVLEFGLRRAQGIDGALSASRAAYIGGVQATSNVLAGRLYGIPVRGTHAHSWVMCFEDELTAFRTYAEAMPNNCVFLVDTYDSLQGVRHAVQIGRELRERGHRLGGIRLDSGDLAYLSGEARKLLDAAGFDDAVIVASNDLDEQIISSLKQQGAAIGLWGVGTRLITGHDQPALGGVYKLTAVRRPGAAWQHKLKLSEQAIKVSNPGLLQVRRHWDESGLVADLIWDEIVGLPSPCTMVDPMDPTRRRTLCKPGLESADLLVPVVRGGAVVYSPPTLTSIREHAQRELARLHPGIRRFVYPHQYPVGLELGLYEVKTDLVLAARGFSDGTSE